MSQENVEIVRKCFEAFRRSDFEALFAHISPDIEVHPNPREPDAERRYEGRDGMLDYLDNWLSGWEKYTVEPRRFIEAGEFVVVEAQEVGIAEQTGIRVQQDYSHAMKIRDRQIVEWRMFGAVEEALEAAGLSEETVERAREG